MPSWTDIAFEMQPELRSEVAAAWAWLVPEPWEPILCSMIGGIFLKQPSGEVLWLDTATALVEPVANTVDEFHELNRTRPDLVDEWFLPGLVERLHEAGKRPRPGECYGLTILPVFAEGKYAPENMFVVPVREQLVGVAEIHKQLAGLPEGASVQVKVAG